MQTFRLNDEIEIVCESARTRNGFKHTATLLRGGRERESIKINYLNRKWEAYEYESVLVKLAEKASLSPQEKAELDDAIRVRFANQSIKQKDDLLKSVALVAKLGEFFGKTTQEKNDWKARMLRAGLENKGFIMPDDWNELDENEKQKRLDGAIGALA